MDPSVGVVCHFSWSQCVDFLGWVWLVITNQMADKDSSSCQSKFLIMFVKVWLVGVFFNWVRLRAELPCDDCKHMDPIKVNSKWWVKFCFLIIPAWDYQVDFMFSTNFLLSRLLSSLASSSIARILFASLPLVFDLHISLTLFTVLSFSVWIPAWTYFSGAHRTSWLNELHTTQICPNLRPTKSELNAPQIFSPTTGAPQDISSTSSILTEIRWKAPPSHLSQLLLLLRSWGLHVQ